MVEFSMRILFCIVGHLEIMIFSSIHPYLYYTFSPSDTDSAIRITDKMISHKFLALLNNHHENIIHQKAV